MGPVLRLLVVSVSLSATSLGLVPGSSSVAMVRAGTGPTNVIVASDRTEPSMVISPVNSKVVVAGTNPDYDENNSSGVTNGHFDSTDGGTMWKGGEMGVVSPYTTEGDPSLAVDKRGIVYFSTLGEGPAFCSAGQSAVLLSKSFDNGKSFAAPTIVDSSSVDHDKPSVAVEPMPKGKDHVFSIWDDPESHISHIYVQRSVDGGKTFSPPALLVSTPWNVFGPTIVTRPGGRITAVWAMYRYGSSPRPGAERIVARTSENDGRSWGPKTFPSHGYFKSLPTSLPPYHIRVLPSPAVSVGPNGEVYVAWAKLRYRWGNGTVSSDILMDRSLKGNAWSPPVVVNDSREHDRFFPTIAPLGAHSLGVAFYDQRNSYNDIDVWAARVTVRAGHLKRGRNVRVTAGTTNAQGLYDVPDTGCFEPGRFLGDYISSAGDSSGLFHVMWADNQRHVSKVTDIFTAAVKLP